MKMNPPYEIPKKCECCGEMYIFGIEVVVLDDTSENVSAFSPELCSKCSTLLCRCTNCTAFDPAKNPVPDFVGTCRRDVPGSVYGEDVHVGKDYWCRDWWTQAYPITAEKYLQALKPRRKA